jgi:peptide/nickel transport system permease protein
MSLRYLIKRLLYFIGVVVFITLFTFVILRITPGDPVDLMFSGEVEVTQEAIDMIKEQLGLDKPLHVQLYEFVRGVFRGDLGYSFYMKRPVWELIRERFPATLELAIFAMLLSFAIGIPIGVIAAVRQNSLLDRLIMGANFVGISMPSFWFAILLMLFFAVHLGALPTLGRSSYGLHPIHITGLLVLDSLLTLNLKGLVDTLRHLVLPCIALGMGYSAIVARILRSSMLEILSQDYITVARSKGLRQIRVVLRHGLRNALIPVITVAGLEAGSLLGGSLVIESIFSWPGLGTLIRSAIFARDYPVVQAGVIFYALVFVMINLVVDIIYTLVDPRIRW